jgi:hypothetical protein
MGGPKMSSRQMGLNRKIIMNTKINSTFNHYSLVKDKNIFEHITMRVRGAKNGATVIVPHVCNNVNAFGAGFAGQVAEKFPIVKVNFHLLGSKARLGHTQFVNTHIEPNYKHAITFANMIAQNKTIGPKNPRPLNYGSLVTCMYEIKSYIHSFKKNNEDQKIEIHAPKFGCGLAGGQWDFVSELINDIWNDVPVFIYQLRR